MPDWDACVRQRLGPRFAAAHGDVVRELAGHLEEIYEELTRRGASPADAEQQALAQVRDWIHLRKNLQRAREGDAVKNQQIRCVWLPGLLTSITAFGLLRAILSIDEFPWAVLLRMSDLFHADYLPHAIWSLAMPWWLVLPLAGAVGAGASWRAGGRPAQRVIAALFPAMNIAGLAVFFLLGKLVQRGLPDYAIFQNLVSATLPWIFLPGVFLLLGSLPFLRRAAPTAQLA